MTLHLTNVSNIAQVSGTIVTADQALQTLTNATLQVDVGNGLMASPVLVDRTRGRNTTCTINCNRTCPTATPPPCAPTPTCGPTPTPKNCNENITNKLKLTDGVVAGIAVGLFFGGFLLAIVVVICCYVCVKCLGGAKESAKPSAIKYQKHADELDSFS